MGLGQDSGGSLNYPLRRGSGRLARRYSKRQRIVGGIAIFLALVFVSGSLFAYLSFRADWNGITRIDVQKDLTGGPKRPPIDPNAMNILLIGSDSRAGANKQFGAEVVGQRSDTIMVVHIAPGAHQVVVLSIPRDTVVPVFGCAPEDGAPGQTAQPAGDVEQINATFAYGGPGCLWKTIEQTTGIRLNDFLEMTFTGFEHVVDDLGGVNVCLPVAIHDTDSKLNLKAGKHHIYGKQALAFWRARYIGEGSDLQRIQRDQYLMAAVLQGIEHSGLLGSPGKMYRVITDVTRNHLIATDMQLSAGRLLSIAEDMRSLPSSSVHFIEVPTVPYPGNPTAWVQLAQPQAGSLFAAIAHDTKLPSTGKAPRHRKASPPVLASVSPADVRVTVLNGTTESGLATSTSHSLASLGYTVVGQPADASSSDYTDSVIKYPSAASLPAARTLAGLVSKARMEQDSTVPAGTVVLILGSTFTGLTTHVSSPSAGANPTASPSTSVGTENLASQFGGINGNVAICSDSSVFAGPDGE